MFLKNVSQFVIISASPKHPQSVTGLVIANNRVRGVKNSINSNAKYEAYLILVFNKRHIPIINSIEEIINAKGKLSGLKKSMWNATK